MSIKGLKSFACGAVLCLLALILGASGAGNEGATRAFFLLSPHSLMHISRSSQLLPDGGPTSTGACMAWCAVLGAVRRDSTLVLYSCITLGLLYKLATAYHFEIGRTTVARTDLPCKTRAVQGQDGKVHRHRPEGQGSNARAPQRASRVRPASQPSGPLNSGKGPLSPHAVPHVSNRVSNGHELFLEELACGVFLEFSREEHRSSTTAVRRRRAGSCR